MKPTVRISSKIILLRAKIEQTLETISQLINTGTKKAGIWKSVKGTDIYNETTKQWTFINADGSFNTAFKLSSKQYENLISTGVVK